MNFEFSDEQKLLREQASSFLRKKSPTTAVREILEGDQPYQRSLWQEMAELGWMSTTIPEHAAETRLSDPSFRQLPCEKRLFVTPYIRIIILTCCVSPPICT